MEMFNTGNIAAINSMRDFSKITMFLAANSTLAASILVTFAYQVGREGERKWSIQLNDFPTTNQSMVSK